MDATPRPRPSARRSAAERTTLLATLAALALAAAPARALDTVDVELGSRDRVDGTLRPADVRETYMVAVPRGARLAAVVKRRGKVGPEPRLALFDPDGAQVGTAEPKKRAKATSVLGATFAAQSGEHRFVVTGDGELDGDYRLVLKARAARLWNAEGEGLEPGAEATFDFAAPAGAVAKLVLRSAGSPLVPRLVQLTGPDGFELDLSAAGTAEAARHVVSGAALSRTGEYRVQLRNDGAATGQYKLKVKLRLPADARRRLNLTDDALAGEFAGAQAVFGRILGPLDGGLLEGGSVGLNLSGVAVDVPPGALDLPTLVTLAESAAFFVGDDDHPGGLTLALQPAGTVFAKPVTVTVPFQAQAYDDPASDMTVYLKDAQTGALEAVPGPYAFDLAAGTVSFQTSHFTRFQSTSRRPRPVKGTFLELELRARSLPDHGGEVTFALNTARGLEGDRTGNQFLDSLGRHTLRWRPGSQGGGQGGQPSTVEVETETGVLAGVVEVQDDEVVRMDLSGDELIYRRGRTPDALLRTEVLEDGALLALAVRQTPGAATRGNLAGRWHAVVLEFGAERRPAGRLELNQATQRVLLDVDGLGVATARKAWRSTAAALLPQGDWKLASDRDAPARGRLLPVPQAGPAVALLEMALGRSPQLTVVELRSALGGDLLVGAASRVEGPSDDPAVAVLRLVVLVRATDTGAATRDLTGRAIYASLGTSVDLGSKPAGLELDLRRLTARHDRRGEQTLAGVRDVFVHDDQGRTVAETRELDATRPYAVRQGGTLSMPQPFNTGYLTRGKALYVLTSGGPGAFGIGFGLPARDEPPGGE
jgi:hypothetical protein